MIYTGLVYAHHSVAVFYAGENNLVLALCIINYQILGSPQFNDAAKHFAAQILLNWTKILLW
jgi:hypothetical protein